MSPSKVAATARQGPPGGRRRLGHVGRNRPPAQAGQVASTRAAARREFDQIAATGEQVTIGLLALALEEARRTGALVHRSAGGDPDRRAPTPRRASRRIDAERLRADCKAGIVPVVAGFQGIDARRQHRHARPRRLGHHRRGAGRRAEGRRVPDLHRCGWRLHHRSACRAKGAPPGPHHLRGNARDGKPRLARCCRSARWNSPASTRFRCACCRPSSTAPAR